jgi:cysteine desulfurase
MILRKNIELLPLLSGGNQEDGLRSSTVSVSMAYTIALAIRRAMSEYKISIARITALNSFLRSHFAKQSGIIINSPEKGSPYIFNFSLLEKKASVVVEALSNEDIMISSVSACHAKTNQFSHVLKALGRDDVASSNPLRISFDSQTSQDEISTFIQAFDSMIARIRS